ncbi:hypothetical protein RZP16_22270, partial [Escherichia coli]|nr:hypothetical protein [Escherichia coli]
DRNRSHWSTSKTPSYTKSVSWQHHRILGGIGMLYFQDLMPGQAGSATTLYTNTSRVGWIIAGSVAGIVAEIWNYHAVFWFAMVMIIATLFCLLRIKDV